MVVNAATSSLTFIVPISAAKAEPERPASTMAVINGPSSRVMARATRLTTKRSTPNCRIGMAA